MDRFYFVTLTRDGDRIASDLFDVGDKGLTPEGVASDAEEFFACTTATEGATVTVYGPFDLGAPAFVLELGDAD